MTTGIAALGAGAVARIVKTIAVYDDFCTLMIPMANTISARSKPMAAESKFGDGENPLLVSVRSGARASMPGMMDTVLNLGLNDVTVAALATRSGDRRFAYDSCRRFITMYADVVLGIAHHHFEEILDELKDRNGYTLDTDLDAADWEHLIARFRERVKEESGAPFRRTRTRNCGAPSAPRSARG
jgi:hypothetical protein